MQICVVSWEEEKKKGTCHFQTTISFSDLENGYGLNILFGVLENGYSANISNSFFFASLQYSD